mgnify:CR=1 FL=1
MRTIRIGTRGSALALKQTEMVRRALARFEPGITTKVHTIRTTGDIHADAPLDAIGGKGVFVKEIERKLLQGEIDCAVHSLKDMQAVVPQGLSIGAYLERDDPRDMLFSKGRHTLEDLPAGVLAPGPVAVDTETLSLIHISEPTRPYYTSYAVFCLKKKPLKINIFHNSPGIKQPSLLTHSPPRLPDISPH